ncbi:hypothetical protein Pogu_1314 [Pyrobaculum oguniense TE7]|uniref:Uncharacterized protein n=1 Tax=Pyrobaculum oguniense (strain DSM 13380 / JCM 10595 / TE7) TaxID=698757 RepID=H6QAE0_PYROT|nr:hypothetical protein Pogu_1314 [Pyrobaculum oguniense TE7]
MKTSCHYFVQYLTLINARIASNADPGYLQKLYLRRLNNSQKYAMPFYIKTARFGLAIVAIHLVGTVTL